MVFLLHVPLHYYFSDQYSSKCDICSVKLTLGRYFLGKIHCFSGSAIYAPALFRIERKPQWWDSVKNVDYHKYFCVAHGMCDNSFFFFFFFFHLSWGGSQSYCACERIGDLKMCPFWWVESLLCGWERKFALINELISYESPAIYSPVFQSGSKRFLFGLGTEPG